MIGLLKGLAVEYHDVLPELGNISILYYFKIKVLKKLNNHQIMMRSLFCRN